MSSAADHVWYRHPAKCWALGRVRELAGANLSVEGPEGGVTTVPQVDTHPCDPSHLRDLDDIAYMNNMHEAPLLVRVRVFAVWCRF